MSKLSHSNDDTMSQLEALRIRRDEIVLPYRGHASDCAVHNMPAYPNGPCDCGFEEKVRLRTQLENAIRCCNDPENCNNEADSDCPTKLRYELLKRLDVWAVDLSTPFPHNEVIAEAAALIRAQAEQLEAERHRHAETIVAYNAAMNETKIANESTLRERRAREEAERYKTAWMEWRSLQTGDVQKLFDAAMRTTAAEAKLAAVERQNRELKEGWRQAKMAVEADTIERCLQVVAKVEEDASDSIEQVAVTYLRTAMALIRALPRVAAAQETDKESGPVTGDMPAPAAATDEQDLPTSFPDRNLYEIESAQAQVMDTPATSVAGTDQTAARPSPATAAAPHDYGLDSEGWSKDPRHWANQEPSLLREHVLGPKELNVAQDHTDDEVLDGHGVSSEDLVRDAQTLKIWDTLLDRNVLAFAHHLRLEAELTGIERAAWICDGCVTPSQAAEEIRAEIARLKALGAQP